MLRLYYWPGYCSLASHIVLNWVGREFELRKADAAYRSSDEFRALNPSSTVPVLVDDDGWTLSQNTAVLTFLAEMHPAAGLVGDTPYARARINRWLGYVNSDVHKSFSPLLHPERVPGDDETRTLAFTQAKDALGKHFAILNDALDGQDWIAGKRSVADAYLFVVTRWYGQLDLGLAALTHLVAHQRRMNEDDDVARSLREEAAGRPERRHEGDDARRLASTDA